MKVKTTLQELMPNEFEVGENEELVAKVSLERLTLIASAITQQHEEIERLHSIIDKAIEYATKRQEWLMNCNYSKIGAHNYINFALEIIDILKGSDKE